MAYLYIASTPADGDNLGSFVVNWDWFYTLYSLSSLIIVFSFLWKVVEKIAVLLIALIFNEASGMIVVNIFSLIPYYFIASFGSLLVLASSEGSIDIVLAIIVGVFIFINDIVGLTQGKQEAIRELNFDLVRMLNWRYLFISAELIFFVSALFYPTLTINKLNAIIYNAITWVQQIPVLNWLIAIVATLYVIYIIIMFLIAAIGPVTAVFRRNTLNQ